MPAQVDLCNMALSKVGESFIRDIAEESRPAKMCALMFAPVRDCVLRAYPWRFALKRWSAVALKKKPPFGFANAFQIPSDCLRILTVEDNIEYAREGDCVLADVPAFNFVGISRVEDPGKFDSLFVSAFTTKLAAELVMSLTSMPALKAQLDREYEAVLTEARRASAKEASPETFAVKGWLEARF